MYQLEYYQKKFPYLHLQGSDDWLDGRQYCFGGSEMSTLLGKNKYDTWEKLVESKWHKSFQVTDATIWGLLFENVAKQFISKVYGKIYEFGSIPHCQYPVCYSPDGVIVEDDHLLLLEIKSPIYRGVKKIPESYLYQAYTGMCILHVKYTLFTQCRFRRCKLGTSPWSTEYDRMYHIEYRKRCKDAYPISFGFLWWDLEGDLEDMSTYKHMSEVLQHVHIKPKVVIEDPSFKPTHGKILMWKLFEIVYASIAPKPNFLKNQEQFLWDKYKELREHKPIASPPQ